MFVYIPHKTHHFVFLDSASLFFSLANMHFPNYIWIIRSLYLSLQWKTESTGFKNTKCRLRQTHRPNSKDSQNF